MRRYWLYGPFLYATILGTACSDQAPVSGLAMGMRAPLGLLDNATSVELSVYAGEDVVCDDETGRVSGSAISTQNFALNNTGCADGAAWCQDITLVQDGEIRTFAVVASAAGSVIGRGCDQRNIDQDPLEVTIDIVPEAEPKCCNDGVVQFGEQCDTQTPAAQTCSGEAADQSVGSCDGVVQDDVCECDCLAREILLTEAATQNPPLLDNAPNTKFGLALAFSGSGGAADVANSMRAVYTDTSGSSSVPDINLRVLDQEFYPLQSALNRQIRLPIGCSTNTLTNWRPGEQREPDIAQLSPEQMLVVWADNGEAALEFDVFGITNNRSGCSDQTQPLKIVDGDASLRFPAVAGGPSGTALVLWNRGGLIQGKVWTGTTIAAGELAVGEAMTETRPAVAGSPAGFVVSYQSPANEGDIVVQRLGVDGTPISGVITVNETTAGIQEQPDVAMLPDGRFVVVWKDGDAIRFQRFDAGGAPVAGDQEGALTETSPAGFNPRVDASPTAAGAFYAAVWGAPGTGEIWGRVFDAQGSFLRNSTNGQFGDFLASHPAIPGARQMPTVAIGPRYMALGWLDTIDGGNGMKVRRFPLPPQ